MKKHSFLLFTLLALCCTACSKYKYETVNGDPLQTRIYTLDNGLKVYMSVNKETPRIQTYIAVKVGGKNDPAQTTGLAHYFEHLMFKGTPNFGTSDYAAEKPKLDRIEELFEIYRTITDEAERRELYYRIDGLSYEASKLAIPNEYDKLMATIGADGSNAYTTQDMTVYIEDIPSNQVENWAKIQADRFKNPVIRGFHTELETIYEEKNRSLTNDGRKMNEALNAALFPHHPYGTQTVLGTQESLKNPSITNVKNYHATYYVPNNMAICLSGDFDPKEMIATINRYFGDMKPNENLPKLQFDPEQPITAPVVREVYGCDAENIAIAWRIGGASSAIADIANIVGKILDNGKAGLLDVDINQQQKALQSSGYAYLQPDYGKVAVCGRPKAGQSLDQLRDLLLSEVAKLRNGDFDEKLLQGTINNYKVSVMETLESNEGRADLYVQSFINGTPWADEVQMLDRMVKITKEEVVAWAQKNLRPENYAVVYKRQGPDTSVQKIAKPKITPIVMNRDATSAFVTEVQATTVRPLKPAFVNYKKDLSTFAAQSDIEVLYKQNKTDNLFTLTYLFETGMTDTPALGTAFKYLRYLGTPTRTIRQINAELYDIACAFSLQASADRSYITLSGLNENMGAAMEIVEDLLKNAQPNEQVLANLKEDLFQQRRNAKLSQEGNLSALQKMLFYGSDFIQRITTSDEAIRTLTSEQLLGQVRDLMQKKHRILYYGPQPKKELRQNLEAHHTVAEHPAEVQSPHLRLQLTPENKVYVAHYDAKQTSYLQVSNRGETFAVENDPEVMLYNEYFNGGMNSIVFQEMRESRSLAYSAQATLIQPSYADTNYGYLAFIATQNDKLREAIEVFAEIIENMPESEQAFNIAKESLLARLRTSRTVKEEVLWSYIDALDMGLDTDRNKEIFEKVQAMTLDDVKATQHKWVRGRNYSYGILGDTNDIDMEYLNTLGPVQVISQEELFGY